jgi:hypothetical protein
MNLSDQVGDKLHLHEALHEALPALFELSELHASENELADLRGPLLSSFMSIRTRCPARKGTHFHDGYTALTSRGVHTMLGVVGTALYPETVVRAGRHAMKT